MACLTHSLKKTILLPAIILLAAACHAPEGYHAFRTLPDEGWKRGDTLYFSLPRQTGTRPCRAALEIRHRGDYPYCSLWLLVSHNTADSLTFRTDTVECMLVDKHGHFDGAGINDLYQKSFPLPDITLHEGSAPTFKIAPFMKDRLLEGISDVGIRLTPTQHPTE